MIIWARDAPPEQFHAGLTAMLTGTQFPYEVLGIPLDVMQWFEARRSKETGLDSGALSTVWVRLGTDGTD